MLKGWTESGYRPPFDVVTGVSTGALIAPYAFLGPKYDAETERLYTSIRREDVFRPQLLWLDSLASSSPLEELIAAGRDAADHAGACRGPPPRPAALRGNDESRHEAARRLGHGGDRRAQFSRKPRGYSRKCCLRPVRSLACCRRCPSRSISTENITPSCTWTAAWRPAYFSSPAWSGSGRMPKCDRKRGPSRSTVLSLASYTPWLHRPNAGSSPSPGNRWARCFKPRRKTS